MQADQVRLLFTAGREPGYVRNTLALAALRRRFDVVERTSTAHAYPRRLAALLPSLALRPTPHDVAFAGFLGQPLALWLRACQRAPIVLDAFVSAYDTICFDRRQAGPRSPVGRAAYWLDRLACAAARVVTVDTLAQAEYFAATFGVSRSKLRTIYLGYDPEVFRAEASAPRSGDSLEVFYYGSYLPLHGIDVIVRAASLLRRESGIRFTLVGRGSTYPAIRKLAEDLSADNVRFVDWLPYERLPAAIAAADVCLGGHFATSGKAGRVIAGKTYQFLAMGRATVVGDCPANRELLTPGEHAWFCPRGSPEGLAEAILDLRRDPDLRHHLASAGQALVQARFAPERAADEWAAAVRLALGERADKRAAIDSPTL